MQSPDSYSPVESDTGSDQHPDASEDFQLDRGQLLDPDTGVAWPQDAALGIDQEIEPPVTCELELINPQGRLTQPHTHDSAIYLSGSSPIIGEFAINTNQPELLVNAIQLGLVNRVGVSLLITREISDVRVLSGDGETLCFTDSISENFPFDNPLPANETFSLQFDTNFTGVDRAHPMYQAIVVVSASATNHNGADVECSSVDSRQFHISPMVLRSPELNARHDQLFSGLNEFELSFHVDAMMDQNRDQNGNFLTGAITSITLAMETNTDIDIDQITFTDTNNDQINVFNPGAHNIEEIGLAMWTPITLKDGPKSLTIGIDIDNLAIDRNNEFRLTILDITYTTGYDQRPLTQKINASSAFLLSRE
jgi:hypothetical protein